MSNSGLDQFWSQDSRQQQQGLDIVEIVRHVVPAVLSSLSAAQQAAQQQNNAWNNTGQFGQQNNTQQNNGQWNNAQQGFASLQGNQQQGRHQQQGNQPQQLDHLIQTVIHAVLGAFSGIQQQQNGAQNLGAQQFNAGQSFNPYANAQQAHGQQGAGQQGQGQQGQGQQNFGQNWGQQNSGQQRNNDQAQGLDLNTLVRNILNGDSAGRQGHQNAQQGGFQQSDAQQFGGVQGNAFGGGQNAYDQPQQQFRGGDLSLLIKAIVPDITKAVVPIVLSTLAGPQQQSRHIN